MVVGLIWAVFLSGTATPDSVTIRHPEGTARGFLVLRDLSGKALAGGDLTQVVHGDQVVARIVFRFKDGSVDDETTVFSQRGQLRLIRDHHVQKGPSYQTPLDTLIEMANGQVTTRYDEKGKQQIDVQRMALPPDLANGLVLELLKNFPSRSNALKVHYLASLPKPRVVELALSWGDKEGFDIENVPHEATRFVIKVDLGGISGAIAPLIGKQPADLNVWVMGGDAPQFIRMEGQLFSGGPMWAVELTTPVWPKALHAAR